MWSPATAEWIACAPIHTIANNVGFGDAFAPVSNSVVHIPLQFFLCLCKPCT